MIGGEEQRGINSVGRYATNRRAARLPLNKCRLFVLDQLHVAEVASLVGMVTTQRGSCPSTKCYGAEGAAQMRRRLRVLVPVRLAASLRRRSTSPTGCFVPCDMSARPRYSSRLSMMFEPRVRTAEAVMNASPSYRSLQSSSNRRNNPSIATAEAIRSEKNRVVIVMPWPARLPSLGLVPGARFAVGLLRPRRKSGLSRVGQCRFISPVRSEGAKNLDSGVGHRADRRSSLRHARRVAA